MLGASQGCQGLLLRRSLPRIPYFDREGVQLQNFSPQRSKRRIQLHQLLEKPFQIVNPCDGLTTLLQECLQVFLR
jgi:hypothetical protein